MQSLSLRVPRRGNDFSKELAAKGWYHSFQLPDGTTVDGYLDLALQRKRYDQCPIPADLHGMRLLDIGAWDGWFSFEAERHGANVTAIDCIEVPHFLEIHRKLSSSVDYRILDFYELPEAGLGKFDIVFFLGVLYHLKHPLLALEIICGLVKDVAIVESFVTNAETWLEHREQIPTMEFYETDELGNQLDNWIGPTVGCLLALCRAAGFARVELLCAPGSNASVACYRKWEPIPADAEEEPPEMTGVANTRTLGLNFSTRKAEYISCWFRTVKSVTRERVRFEVGGFGVPALYVRDEGSGTWMANFRLPPGLDRGWNAVRLRFANSAFGPILRIAVDMPPKVDELLLDGVLDGITLRHDEISLKERGYISCWVKGLPENADLANIGVYLGELRLGIEYIGEPDLEGSRQINAVVPGDVPKGEYAVRIECGGVSSGLLIVNLVN